MYQTILVPLDGSLLAERAITTATTLARITLGKIVLVRAVSSSTSAGSDSARTPSLDEAERYLKNLATTLRGRGIETEMVVSSAPPAEAILREADARDADLIVMSTHGRSGLGRWIYGSVAEAVLTRSLVPILLVRANSPDPVLLPLQGYPRLLVPLDGSPVAEAAVPHAIALARVLHGGIVVLQALTVVAPDAEETEIPPLFPSLPHEQLVRNSEEVAAREYLQSVVDQIRSQGVPARAVVRPGPPVEAIIEEGWRTGASLAVLATHGRTGLSRLLLGSVAAELLRRGSLPVVLIRSARFAPLTGKTVVDKALAAT